MDKYSFQNCQKIVVFSKDNSSVLLAKRLGEKDFDSIFSFIGGKMETGDKDIIEGLKREKNEEVGSDFIIKINTAYNSMNFFTKKDGSKMILPHYYAQHVRGDIKLNSSEYSEYKWVPVSEIDKFEPKIPNIPEMTKRLLKLVPLMTESDFVEI